MPDTQLIEALSQTEITTRAAPASQALLARCGLLRTVVRGEHLFRDKEPVLDIFILRRGLASIYKYNSHGEKKVIFVLGPGALLNETLDRELCASANCQIIEEAEVLCFDQTKFLAAMRDDFELTRAVLTALSLKIRRLYRQLKNTTGSVRGDKRLAAKLWKLARDHGLAEERGVRLEMRLSITYLADMLGAQRETISRQLSLLVKEGLVVIDNGIFLIPDQDRLAEYFKEP